MKLVSALAAVVLLVVTAAPSAQAIMEPTPGSQIYFVASMQEPFAPRQSPHYCGGVLIAHTWVITAKQCAEGKALESIQVRTGSRYYTGGGALTTVSQVVPHPAFDVALVQLSERGGADPAPIAERPGPVGTWTKVLGWGQTCPASGCGGPVAELQEVFARTEPASACGVEKDRLCAAYPNGGGPCYGDEGGPMIESVGGRWHLVGIVPSTPTTSPVAGPCDRGRSSLVDVTVLRDWISQHTGA